MCHDVTDDGISPACAGSREHTRPPPCGTALPESSPRARGAQLNHVQREPPRGIIPAYAGSTSPRRACTPSAGDHPRMCGEHIGSAFLNVTPKGLSPHSRGALPRSGPTPPPSGIIPACAGSTQSPCVDRRRRWDHPRMRGEHQGAQSAGVGRVGSSPHARGARSDDWDDGVEVGIIPACAGSTRRRTWSRRRSRDHPRMRGEHPCVTRSPVE